MAQEIVRFTTGSSSSLNGTAKQAGRVYFAVDSNNTTGSIYFDKDGTHRVRMSAPALTQLNINGEEIGTLNLSAGATTGTITVKRNTFVIGSSTTNGQWVGELQYGGITELYDGFAIDYWIDKPGVSSGTTLNLVLSDGSSSGNLPVYYQGTTRLTTHYGVNNVIHLVYRDMTIGSTAYRGWWCQGNYYVNDFYRLRVQAAAVKAESAITAGNLIVGTKNGYKHLNAGTSFDINYPILYAGSAIAAGATSDNTYAFIPFAVTTTQGISLTAQQAVFIKGTLNGSTFTPVSTAPLTQTVPTSEDGYFYINLGLAYNGTSMYLFPEHRIMKFINSAFQEVIYIAQRAYSDSLGQKISTTYVAGGTIETDAANHKATYGNGEGGSPWEFSLPFVRLSGDTMTGDLTFSDANKGVRRVGRSMNWNKGRDGAILASTSINGYSPLWSVKTTAGSWDVGAYNSTGYQEELIFSYVPDTLYNGTNTTPTQIRFQKDGTINGTITKAQKDSLGNLITENYVAYGSISVDGENHKMTYENKAGSSTDVTLPFVKRSGDTMSGNLTVSSQVNATGNNKTISLYASTNRGIYDNSNSEWLIYRAADGNTAYIVNKGKTWTFDNSGNLTTPAGATSTANLIGTATRAINDVYGVALTSYYNASSINGKTLTLTTGAGVDKNLTIDLATFAENLQVYSGNECTVGSSSSATNSELWINWRSQKGGATNDNATKLVKYYFGNRKGSTDGVTVQAATFLGNLTGNVTGNITGNADTADKWKTARSFTIKDYSLTNAGTPTNVDGSANVTLYMPSTIEAQQFVALGGKTNDTTTAIRSSGNIVFEQSSTTTREVRFQVGTNDYARLAAGATQANAGWIELATGDDGNEPVYARQYSGVFSSIKRTLTLLDASGNTIFPGNALPEVTNSVSLGSSTYRWKAAYIGTADSYGGNTKFIYWLNGVPTAASGTIGSSTVPVWIDGGTIKSITSYSGNSATATTARYLSSPDTRSTNPAPSDYEATSTGVSFDFKTSSVVGLTGSATYSGVMTYRPYAAGSDWSGGNAHQIAFNNNGLYWRNGGSSWGNWTQLVTNSGTWSINITGNAGSATKFNTSRTITLTGDTTGSGSGDGSNGWSITTTTGKLAYQAQLTTQDAIDSFIEANKFKIATFKTTNANNVGMASNDGMIISIPWSSTAYGAQMAFDDVTSGVLKFRGRSSSTWGDWRTVLHDGNYTTYTVKKDGTGASGTWSINITGKAGGISPAGTTAQFWRGDNTWSDTISGGTLKITNNSNTFTIGSQNGSFNHLYNSANIPFIFNNSILTTTGNLGNTDYPWNNIYIGKTGEKGIYYVGTKATSRMITFIDNTSDAYGNGIKIGGGGAVVIGAGESAANLSISAGSETLYLLADGAIHVGANGDTIANRIGFQVTTAGHILPEKADAANNLAQDIGSSTQRWRDIHANALKLSGPSSNPSASAGARIEFSYDASTNVGGSQPVYLAYTPNDAYRAPAGIKLFGGSSATPAWFEVEGSLYSGHHYPNANNTYTLGSGSLIWNAIHGNWIHANRSSSSTDYGITLYAADSNYAIMFRGTGNRGKWGDVQSDWATYFTMNSASQRGWVWQGGGTAEANMSAALSSRGVFTARAVGNNQGYVAFPQNGSYMTSTPTVTGALKITLPQYKTNTMMKFDVHIYTYEGANRNSVVYHIGGYEYGDSGWYNNSSRVYSEGYGPYTNLTVRFGYDGNKACVTIGETNTTWNYPQVEITNIIVGYLNYNTYQWGYGWSISFETTLPSSISGTYSNVNAQMVNVLGTNGAASPAGALLQSGPNRADNATGDSWIFWDTLGGTASPWGIKHDQANNRICFYGAGTQGAYITLNTGDAQLGNLNIPWGKTITFFGKNNNTSPRGVIGYYNSMGGVMHCQNSYQTDGALYISSNGATSANDNGGIAIDNEGVTVFGAGDAGDNFTGVFRVINEDNVAAGPVFLVTKAGLTTAKNTIHAEGGYLKSTMNNKVLQMGSQNADWCHMETTADKFYFNKHIQAVTGFTIYNTGNNNWRNGYLQVNNSSGGDCYLELLRATNADWRMLNSGGNLYFQSDYTTAKGSYFNVLQLNYDSGNITVNKGGIIAQHGHNFIVGGNEFNCIPDNYNSTMWFNYQSFSRNSSSTVTSYTFGNGHGGVLATISSGQFSGNAATATAFSSNATVTLTGDTTGTSAGSTKSWTIATTTNLHQTNWDFTTTQPLSKYTTFDKSNPVGAPTQTWYNGFVSSHSNYLASYIVNAHRSANWYVGYGEWSSSTKTAAAPTWYKLLHSGNYNDYSPTLTGTGASGTWGINISGNAATATAADRLTNVDITVKTNSAASQSHISTETFINWLITQGYIPNKVSCTRIMKCSWSYAGNDILQLAYDGKNYEIQLAGCIIEFKGYIDSTYANGNNVYRLIIRTSPTNSFTAASGYIKVPTSSDWEFTCNGSGYSPTWRCTSHTLDYNTGTITRFGYGTSGMTSTSWLACWDGYNLRALNPTNNNIGALTAHRPLGFASDSQSSAGWGNQTGTGVTTWNDASGGSIEFRKDNPSSGKLSIKVDGRFYGNEGNNPAMLMTDANGYWGMGTPDANATAWIRTTSAGIIPYQSGGVMSGHQGLGTSSWYFADSYITRMYTHQLIVQGTVPSATMNAGEDHPRITFQEGTETQPVHLMYSDWDSYRSPAGLKVIGGTSATPAWFEVEGNLYSGHHYPNANNTYDFGSSSLKWRDVYARAYYGILGQTVSETASDIGGLTWQNHDTGPSDTVNANDGPTSAWWYILRNRHTNTSNNYYTDLAIPFNANSIYYKIIRGGSIANSTTNHGWVQVMDQLNWKSVMQGNSGAAPNNGTANRVAYYSDANTINSANSLYVTTNTLSINHTAQGSATLYKDLANTSYTLDPRFYVNGNSLFNGTIVVSPNLRAIEFRPNYQTYNSYIYYGTAGNEALNFVNRQSVTSFIFWTGNSVNGSDKWYLDEAGAARTDNPAVQIKQNCLYINKLLPSGTSAAYQLYVNGNICIGSSGDKGIYYQGTKNTYRMIRFIDNTADAYGNGISIGGGGLTILGSGESADTMVSNLGYTGGSEATVIASDGNIRFFPGNNSYDASAELTMTASRFWAGVDGNTTREAQVGCQSGAGQLYFWSAASTSGARGLWLPAHGTGGAFAIINANTNNYVTILGNDVWGSQVRLVDNWVGFYNARQGGTRYGYIQTNANRMYFAKENGINGYAFDFNGSLYTEAGVYQKVRVVQGLSSDTAGWKRCCRIYARYNYGNCIVMFTGGWNNGAPTMTTISIQLRNGGANMKVLHTGFTGRIKDVRIVKKDGTTNEYWLDVNLLATSAATADLYATFIGNIIVDTIQDNQPGGTGTAAAEVNVEGLTAKEGIREGTASRVAYYSTAGRINSAANLVTDGNYLSNVTYLTVNAAHQTGYRFKVNGEGYATKFWNAVWNDYAEHRKTVKGVKFGQVVYEDGTGEQHITEHRLMNGCNITSDTFGTSMGKRPDCETPIAVAGRVLAYIYESRDKFKPGDAVCSGPNGTVSKMSRKEIRRYPDAIIGYVSEIPDYEIWYAGSEEEPTEIKVDGRIWIKVN